MPEWLVYDLGDIQILNKTQLSFLTGMKAEYIIIAYRSLLTRLSGLKSDQMFHQLHLNGVPKSLVRLKQDM